MSASSAQAGTKLTLFAAASLAPAVTHIAKQFELETKTKIAISAASSSTLARQIEAGAPADIFLSANLLWMDHLEKQGLLTPNSRQEPLGNHLVLAARQDLPLTTTPAFTAKALQHLLGTHGQLVMGDPAHVPVGIYGKQTLEALSIWPWIQPRLARADNARAAIAILERGEVTLGLLYLSDLKHSKKLKQIAIAPLPDSEIRYSFALLNASRSPKIAAEFLAYLTSGEAQTIFKEHGFSILKPTTIQGN